MCEIYVWLDGRWVLCGDRDPYLLLPTAPDGRHLIQQHVEEREVPGIEAAFAALPTAAGAAPQRPGAKQSQNRFTEDA